MGDYEKNNFIEFPDKAMILGSLYIIKKLDYSDDSEFERKKIDGYCEYEAKIIVVGNLDTFRSFENSTPEIRRIVEKTILRHEIVHAFLFESGLGYSSNSIDGPWALNEEMVDWIAMQGPKIMKVWQELGIAE